MFTLIVTGVVFRENMAFENIKDLTKNLTYLQC